jgi:hypothetical protein
MTDYFVKRFEDVADPAAERKRQALLKEFGLDADFQEAVDPAPAVRAIVLLGIAGLFIASMFFPAVSFARPGQPNGLFPTWGLLVTGWATFATVMLIGVFIELSVKQERWATMTAACGVLFAALTFLLDTVPPEKNNGPPFPIVSFELGFYLWQGSMLLGLIGSAVMWWLDIEANRAPVLEEAAAW